MNCPAAGRFAPSPTGPLHLGSLIAALASYLDAKANGIEWWVRMEDIDPPREQRGAAETILQQLRDHGLDWDDFPTALGGRSNGVLYQSDRYQAYQSALLDLYAKGLCYECSCSRSRLLAWAEDGLARRSEDGELLYPGICRPPKSESGLSGSGLSGSGFSESEFSESGFTDSLGLSPLKPGHAARFRSETALSLEPRQGLDDFVIRRADGLWSYHLAVVIDDAHQGIARIVRGDDLLASLPRHRMLQSALGLHQPEVIHVPVARNSEGQKLSKQNQAKALGSGEKVMSQLKEAWAHLETHMPRAWVEAVEAPMQEKFRLG